MLPEPQLFSVQLPRGMRVPTLESGGIPPLQGVHVFSSRASTMCFLFARRSALTFAIVRKAPARRELPMGKSEAVPLPHPLSGVQNRLGRQLVQIDFNLGVGSTCVEELRGFLQRLSFGEAPNR